MPPWILEVISFANKESKYNSSRWVQLATVSADNTPRVRTVVFRGWSDSYKMKLLIDKRSKKYKELISNQAVEICWLFPKSKCQFRFRGTSEIDMSEERNRNWDTLDNKSKSMWGWPKPGVKFDSEISIKEDEDSNKLDNFILLNINIFHVDKLLLSDPIHIRKQWIKKNEWIEERINP